MKRILVRGTTALVGASALALGASALASADDSPISAAIGGVSSPASGDMSIQVQATDTAAKLVSAVAIVDGRQVGVGDLCPADSNTNCQAQGTTIGWHTTDFPDGVHQLVVRIADANGTTLDKTQSFEILNHPPQGSPSQTLNIGSGSQPQQNGSGNNGGSGGVAGASASSCTSPKLSMQLAQKPLRVSKGHPVLQKGKRYRFTGRLTCVVNGKRHSAPKKTRVEENDVVKGKRSFKGGTLVQGSGKVSIIIAVTSSRTIEFSVTDANGKTSRVRIKVTVSKQKRKG
jgi:hypothetical protein